MGNQKVIRHDKIYSRFLGITHEDIAIVKRYSSVFKKEARGFSEIFYSYLMSHDESAKILLDHEKSGNSITHLIDRQVEKFIELIETPEIGDTSKKRIKRIARQHEVHDIDPFWIIGGYLIYLQFLYQHTQTSPEIPSEDRKPLYQALNKLVFRELGLMINTYWEDALDKLRAEKSGAESLRNEIQTILRNIPQILWSVDATNDSLIYISPAFKSMCVSATPHTIPCFEATVDDDKDDVTTAWNRALTGETVIIDSRIRLKSGEHAWFRRKFIPAADDEGRITRIDGIMEDITGERKTLDHLHRLATTDPLTGLLNRLELHDRARTALSASKRSGSPVLLFLFDLDRFKVINDSLGHPTGDEVLRQAAARIQEVLRPSDSLSRLGGDEFSLLIPESNDCATSGHAVAHRVSTCFEQPFLVNGHSVSVKVSIGIATSVCAGHDIDELFRQCDVAMYTAKRNGNVYAFFDDTMDTYGCERIKFEEELRNAFKERQFELHYQPKQSLADHSISGVEALIRWKHPEHGTLLPGNFLNEVESLHLMPKLTEYVFRCAFEQANAWRQENLPIKISVNVSASSLYRDDFFINVKKLCDEYDVSPEWFSIEITEAVVLHDIAKAIKILGLLKDIGFNLALDDYGTGYSSLAYLKKLPLCGIKIDKTFILDLCRNEPDKIIVSSTIDLAHSLGFNIIAEGVEDEETAQLLARMGCDEIQGYFLSKPLDSKAINAWLRQSTVTGH